MKVSRAPIALAPSRAQGWFGLSDTEENSMKRILALAFLFVSSVANAQTTTTPAPTTPPPATIQAVDSVGSGFWFCWRLPGLRSGTS
jgi:hypothetical protein